MSLLTLKHRRFRFSLVTLFVVVTAAACLACWMGYGKNWVQQRQALLERGSILSFGESTIPPFQLWIIGETGHQTILIRSHSREDTINAQALFPEARIACSGPEFD